MRNNWKSKLSMMVFIITFKHSSSSNSRAWCEQCYGRGLDSQRTHELMNCIPFDAMQVALDKSVCHMHNQKLRVFFLWVEKCAS